VVFFHRIETEFVIKLPATDLDTGFNGFAA
jgi:hypothetical protein